MQEALYSLDTEQSLIGALILDPDAIDRVGDLLSAEDFYVDRHRVIYRRLALMVARNLPLDVVTLAEALDSAGETARSGGLSYLGQLVEATPGSRNLLHYARIVADKRRLRSLFSAAADITAIASLADGKSAEERISVAQELVLALGDGRASGSQPRLLSEMLPGAIETIETRFNSDSPLSGLSTGYSRLDEETGGLQKGDLIIVAGRPSMGKTALALNIAENVATSGRTALVFSFEMSGEQLTLRTLARASGVNMVNLRSGKLQDDDFSRLSVGLGKLADAKLVIDATSGLSPAQMRIRARRIQRQLGLSLIVVDYLQLMSSEGNTRNEELGAITRALKLLARDLDVPVVLLSQLNRSLEQRANKRPIMSDLRESGAIEQDADVVIMLYRDEYYDPNSPHKGLAEIIIRKQRMGACGDFFMSFEGEYSRFSDHNAPVASIPTAAPPRPRRQQLRDD